jgi:NADH:ubiquinone oxidoreductase subunit F (NADH-binding)/Pyruvate/2-oxoacid:ferredoxin oxidoreductase delta subunit
MKRKSKMETLINTQKDFLIENIIKQQGTTAKEELSNQLRLICRKDVTKPAIYIGAGTCGLGAGAGKTKEAIIQYLNTNEIEAELLEVGCIGLCSAEPLVDVKLPGFNRVSFSNVGADKVNQVLNSTFNMEIENEQVLCQFDDKNREWEQVPFLAGHPFFEPQERLVLKNCGIVNPTSIDEYIALGGYKGFVEIINKEYPDRVCDIVEQSELRGRGGGGFPTGKKWKFAAKTDADQKYLICNADEGDPGAFMDRAVIEGDPHRLIEGMAIAAYAIGASEAIVYIRAEYPLAIERLKIAIDQAKEYGFIGSNVYDSGFNFKLKVKMGAGAFVCGEETALIHSIEGKRGMPRPRPPFPAVQGLFGKPTIINNVESLANIPGIISNGASWFASRGTDNSKGTKVFALSGKVQLTGLIEVPMGTTIREVIFDVGGGIPNNKEFKAVQIGGPSGGCITKENLDIKIDYDSLIEVGAMMGSGGLVVMDEDTCMVDVAKFFMDFIQRESCGKCIPCREGTRRMLEILEAITRKPVDIASYEPLERIKSVMRLETLSKVIKETSLCGLGQTAPNPVLSTLRWFREEYEEHLYDRKCSAGVCTDLRTFTIEVDKCTGCMVCRKKCPTDAIIGARKTPHFIVEDKCISCGACHDACKFDAIEIS